MANNERKRQISEILDISRSEEDAYEQIGIYEICAGTAKAGWTDKKTGFTLSPGDIFVEVHLPPRDSKGDFLERTRNADRELAEYLGHADIKPKIVFGVTYEYLAKFARDLFEYTIADINIPEKKKKTVEDMYTQHSPRHNRGIPMGEIVAIYQTTDNFIRRNTKPQ